MEGNAATACLISILDPLQTDRLWDFMQQTAWQTEVKVKRLYAADCLANWGKSEEKKSEELLAERKEENEKAGLKLNIQKTKSMASGPITSWQIEGEKVEALMDFIFLGSKITADGNHSHEIKRCLVLGKNLWPT